MQRLKFQSVYSNTSFIQVTGLIYLSEEEIEKEEEFSKNEEIIIEQEQCFSYPGNDDIEEEEDHEGFFSG